MITAKDVYENTTNKDTDGSVLAVNESVTFSSTATASVLGNVPTYNGDDLTDGTTVAVDLSTGSFTTSNILFYNAAESTTIMITHNTKTGSSGAVTVSTAGKSRLGWVTEPAVLGVSMEIWPAFSVEITDPYGNQTTDTDAVRLMSSGSVLSGTTVRNAVSGLVTFTNVYYNHAGSITVTAEADGLTSTSASAPIIVAVNTIVQNGEMPIYNPPVVDPGSRGGAYFIAPLPDMIIGPVIVMPVAGPVGGAVVVPSFPLPVPTIGRGFAVPAPAVFPQVKVEVVSVVPPGFPKGNDDLLLSGVTANFVFSQSVSAESFIGVNLDGFFMTGFYDPLKTSLQNKIENEQ
jgi:hypothetical protein